MRRLWVFGLVVVMLAGVVAFPGPAVADAQVTNTSNQSQASFDETQFVVTVYENGSARWTQRYNQPLSNQTEIQNFRAYADRFTSEETPVYTDFRERATRLAEEGSNATGREMAARGFTREAQVTSQPTATGVVEMSFLWTNFTAREGGIVVGDAFENGLYLSSEMSLEIRAGPNLDVAWESVEPTPDASTNGSENASDSLTYFGETQFAGGHPRVAFAAESPVVTDDSSPFDVSMLWIAGVFVLGAVVLGTVVLRRADRPLFRTSDDEAAAATAESDTDDETEPAETTDAADADTAETGTETPPAVSEAELRSDEDRVTALLEANGGRMQQGAIVAETGWSKSKVSMLLSEMEAEGEVSKLRVGRENIVSLAGHEPEAARSPFEDG